MDKTFTRRRPREFDGTSSAELTVFEATEKLLGDTPLQDLTVATMISEAGVSRANFYHYFANKFDVLVALLRNVLEESYATDGPWTGDPGRARARQMGASLESTLKMWSQHGAVICAVLEHMHTRPAVAAAWQQMFARFVEAITEQIEFERSEGLAPAGPPAEVVAAMLVGGAERSFYVTARGLDPAIPAESDLLAPLEAITEAAIYGRQTGDLQVGPVGETVMGTLVSPQIEGVTARSILDALRDLLVEHSLADVSVSMVLDRAGVSRASFYFYFRNIEDAFIALFREAAIPVVGGMAELAAAIVDGRGNTDIVRTRIKEWLIVEGADAAVIRNAVHAWPRLADLRAVYLEAMGAMHTTLESLIVIQRQRGVVPTMPAVAGYTSALLWTVERAIAGTLAGEGPFTDGLAVVDAVSELLTVALLGVPSDAA
jgi:AcrR family transcriptional regulator